MRRIGLASPQREAADHGHTPRLKDGGFRETDAFPIAFEEPGNTHPLGMIATEARVEAIDLLESVGEPCRGQLIRREPPAEIAERSCNRRKDDTDQCESCQRGAPVQALLARERFE